MPSKGVVLCSNISVVADQPAVNFLGGGRAVVVIEATTYPTSCQLQVQSQGSGKWVAVNSTTFSADGVYAFDVPPGQVRMHMSGGTVAGLYAALVTIPYI